MVYGGERMPGVDALLEPEQGCSLPAGLLALLANDKRNEALFCVERKERDKLVACRELAA
jgi:hypothetical protein